MKNLIMLFSITLLLASCDKGAEKSVAEIIEDGDVTAITEKRKELSEELQALNAQLKDLDEKLKDLNPDKNVPLITAFVAKDTLFEHFIELQGDVETDQNIVITPEMGGILTNVYVKEGQKVNKGQLLAKVDDGGMGQQLAQMQVQADLAKTTFERQERLWNQKIGSEIQFLQSKSAYEGQLKAINSMQQQLGKSNIRAPFSGTIDDIITERGSVVAPGSTSLMRIVNLDNMHIKTDVPEGYLPDVTKGKQVEVFFPVLNKTLAAKVSQTGSFINPNNRTYKVEIDIPNKEKDIKPNLTARLKINDYTRPNSILIPQSIISENANGDQYVYLLSNKKDGEAVAKRVIVTTGKTQEDTIEILEGLKAGDEIIEEGARSVKDGQRVKMISY